MPRKPLSFAALLFVLAMALALLGGCTDDSPDFRYDGEPVLAEPAYARTPPPLKLAEYVGEKQVLGDDGYATGLIDYSNADAGYVAVQITTDTRAKVIVTYSSAVRTIQDNMNLNNDGEMEFLPLAYGAGRYVIELYYHNGGETNAYYNLTSVEVDAAIPNEYAPFTTQSLDVNYNAASECVAFSYELTKNCASDLEVARMIYWWVSNNVTYDTAKAETVSTTKYGNFTPDPDTTLRLGTGICYDYAALTAAMLRANGIPCRLVIGDVPSGGQSIRHAWNHIWLEDVGFVAVEISVNQDDWTRIDATFNAAGASQAQFIGDGSNYNDIYYH